MSCATLIRCLPTGQRILEFYEDSSAVATSRYNLGTDASPIDPPTLWAGDESLLRPCGVSLVTVQNNVDGSINVMHISGDGTPSSFQIPATPQLVDNGDGTLSLDTGSSVDICDIVATNCAATIVDNADGTALVTGNDGNPVTVSTVDTFGAIVQNMDGSLTWTSHDGSESYTWTSSTPSDICAFINANCAATILANPDGSYTVTGNDGNSETIPAPATGGNTSVVQDLNTATGTKIIATHDDGAGNTENIKETLVTIRDNPDGTQTLINEDGIEYDIVAPPVASGNTSILNSSNTGNVIASHDDGAGNTEDIEETVTNVTPVSGEQNSWEFVNEEGATQPIKVEFCYSMYPTPVDKINVTDTPGSADPYRIDDKPTLVCVLNGLTGEEELYLVRRDATGANSWFMIA